MPLPITRPDSCDKLVVFTHAQKAFLGVVHTEFIAYIYNNSIVASYFKGMFGKKLIIVIQTDFDIVSLSQGFESGSDWIPTRILLTGL